MMQAIAIINQRAGAALGERPTDWEERVADALRGRIDLLKFLCIRPEDLPRAIESALKLRPDILIVGGGDGTLRTAAALVVDQTHTALGILPLGTFNRVARDLGVPTALDEALRTICEGNIRRIDVAEVNGRVFLSTSLLGLPVFVAQWRQRLRGQTLSARLRGYARLGTVFLRSTRRVSLQLDSGGDAKSIKTLSVIVSNNAYDPRAGRVFSKDRLDGGHLGIYLSRHTSGRAFLMSLRRALMGRWSSDPELEEIHTTQVVVTSRRSTMTVSNDGEVEKLATPLHYSIRAKALKVIVPAQMVPQSATAAD